jgi:hypothetical protein
VLGGQIRRMMHRDKAALEALWSKLTSSHGKLLADIWRTITLTSRSSVSSHTLTAAAGLYKSYTVAVGKHQRLLSA